MTAQNPTRAFPDGEVALDSEVGRELGFTSDLFYGWLWVDGDAITVSFIDALHPLQGDFSRLIAAIWAHGYSVKVPTPSRLMRCILFRKGFKQTVEFDKELGPVELWVKPTATQYMARLSRACLPYGANTPTLHIVSAREGEPKFMTALCGARSSLFCPRPRDIGQVCYACARRAQEITD